MTRQRGFFLATLLVLSAAPRLFASDERPRIEIKGLFGNASFTDVERHDVGGAGLRFNITDRFSIEPEVLFMQAPLDCFRCGSGRDEDMVATANFLYRLDSPGPDERVFPYFVAGIGYLRHRERWDDYDSTSGSLWMHFGLGLKIRVSDRLSVIPEYRVGVDGGYATLSASYGWLTSEPRNPRAAGREHLVAVTVEGLKARLPNGGRVDVHDVTGARISGRLESIGEMGESLTLRTGDRTVDVRLENIYRIDARVSDPLTNGIYIGAGVGAGLGLLGLAGCGDCGGEVYGVLFVAGLGAGIGMLVDAAILSKESLYLEPSNESSSVTFHLAPYMTRDKRGLLATLSF